MSLEVIIVYTRTEGMKQIVSPNVEPSCLFLNNRTHLDSPNVLCSMLIESCRRPPSFSPACVIVWVGDLPSLLACLVQDGRWRTRFTSPSFSLSFSSCSGWFLNSILAIEMFLDAPSAHIKLNKKVLAEHGKKEYQPHTYSPAGNSLCGWQCLRWRTCFMFWFHYFLMMNLC